MPKSDFSFAFSSGEVLDCSVRKYNGGYNYAQLTIKKNRDEYISISYEWQGDAIPDLAMDILGFMQQSPNQATASIEDKEKKAEAATFVARLKECL